MNPEVVFRDLVSGYSDDMASTDELWSEIHRNYSKPGRHYHNLSHLKSLLSELTEVKSEIENWNCLLFSVFYHDIIYNPTRSDNEERSAGIAHSQMIRLGIPEPVSIRCKNQILETKHHRFSPDSDANFLTDADLSILGANLKVYLEYARNVRKEYKIYPDLIYNPGRKKVLKHFLEMNRIFKTDWFFQKFEEMARVNLQQELDAL